MLSFAGVQAAAGLGMGFVTFTAAFRLLQSTGSATAYGIVAATSLIPSGITSPWIGSWIDREHPGAMTWVSALGSAASVLVIALAASLELSHPAWAWASLSLAYLSLTALYSAEVPYARGLVPSAYLSRANAALQLTALVPRLGGTAVASFAFAAGSSTLVGLVIAALVVVCGAVARFATWPFAGIDREPSHSDRPTQGRSRSRYGSSAPTRS